MNQTDIVLQFVFRFVGLLDLLVGAFAWSLDRRDRSNRYLTALLLTFAFESFALGQLLGATNVDQAEPWLYVVAATTLSLFPLLFATTLSLLRPEAQTQTGRERWLWRIIHLLILSPPILILSDVLFDTGWVYTGPDPQAYTGGFLITSGYLRGTFATFMRILHLYMLTPAALLPPIYALWFDRQSTPLVRQRARWLLGAIFISLLIQMVFRPLIGDLWPIVLTDLIYAVTFTIMLLRSMLSDALLRKQLADVRLRSKLYIGLSAAIVGVLVIGGIGVYSSASALQLVSRDLTRQRELADRAARINANLLTLQSDTFEFYNAWTLYGFERTVVESGFEFAQSKYLDPIRERLQEVRDDVDAIKRLKPDEETQTSMDAILTNVNDYEASLLEMSSRMESLGADTTGEMGEIQAIRGELLSRLQEVGTDAMQSTLFQIGQHEKDFFLRTNLASSRLALELVDQLAEQITATDDAQITPADKTELVASLESYEDHFYAATSHHRNLQEIRTTLTGRSGLASVQVRNMFEKQQADYGATAQRLERQQFNATIVIIGLGLLTLFTSAAVAYYVAGQIIQPVQILGATAEQLGAGELAVRADVHGQDEIGATASAFNFMANQLQEVLAGLEQQVADRTRDLERRSAYLEASAEVGRAVSSILEPDDLIRQVVELIREQFDLYYVGLFQVDEEGEWAVLRAGTGEAGRTMLARGHRIRVGEGMIGWSVANAQARVALEAGEDAVRLATAELPETRSEAAVPMRSRGQVLGALTVQHTRPNAFGPGAIAALQTMADQVAVALDNARLFTESQAALLSARRAYGELSRQAWFELLQTQSDLGFRSDESGVARSEAELWQTEVERPSQTVQGKGNGADDQERHPLSVPIKVGGQTIGVLDTYKPGETGDWTPQELTLLQEITNQLALALDNARLHQDTRLHAMRERLTSEITTRLRGSLDVESVLRTAVDEIYQVLELDQLTISLSPEGIRSANQGPQPHRGDGSSAQDNGREDDADG